MFNEMRIFERCEGKGGQVFDYCLFHYKTTDFRGVLISHPCVEYTDGVGTTDRCFLRCQFHGVKEKKNFDEMQSHEGVNNARYDSLVYRMP